jgi:uncharacterized membrane protein YhaH (DUF805 family)
MNRALAAIDIVLSPCGNIVGALMNFQQAIRSGFANYVNFRRRAARSEFWYWILFAALGGLVAEIFDFALFSAATEHSPLADLFQLATLLPGFAVAIRRLHDTDRTGWWLLLGLIPLIGVIVLIVWWCTKGGKGYNRFGADPLPAEPRPRHRVREAMP